MGIVDYFLCAWNPPEIDVNLLFLGLDNSGKSCILRRFTGDLYRAPATNRAEGSKSIYLDEITTITPTQGHNIETLIISDKKVNVWDIGGELIRT
jgi:GTPase SAR1 family protein